MRAHSEPAHGLSQFHTKRKPTNERSEPDTSKKHVFARVAPSKLLSSNADRQEEDDISRRCFVFDQNEGGPWVEHGMGRAPANCRFLSNFSYSRAIIVCGPNSKLSY